MGEAIWVGGGRDVLCAGEKLVGNTWGALVTPFNLIKCKSLGLSGALPTVIDMA